MQHSFWADDLSQERMIWSSCLNVLAQIDKPILIHYGAYETQFLKTMRQRYSDLLSGPYVDQLLASSVNLLSFTYDRFYFPTYSNSLKDIAGYLGFQWSESSASGRKAMSWRSTWELLRDPDIKQKLLTYNAEDCAALQKISELILSLTSDEALPAHMEPIKVALDTAEYPHQFGEVNFVVPAFSQINKAAYWDYQRNKVYVRSNRRLKRLAATRNNSVPSRTIPANKIIYAQAERPAVCRRCENTLTYKTGRFSQTVYDIRISDAGLKRWVVRYRYDRYLCWNCKASFHQYERQGKWGLHLKAYVIYQMIELRISMHAIGRSLQSLFGFDIRGGAIHLMKSQAAERYGVTYQDILHRLASGKLVHADETKVTIGDETHYIWVFTNLEEVAFVHSESRDASTAKEVLKRFQGVLVSDFYAGYDSIDCAQQKCLVHLMRDINDDLRAHPFDEELKEFGQDFALLLKPMIDTIDRFGLKTHHLRKHRSVVDQFYRTLSQKDYTSEVAASYKKRFEKNQNKLFTFLDYDDVPWNNNNAEHAIKAFARLRKNLGAKSSIKGMRDYLVLLSISETCQYKGVSFLHFLMSGEMDIDRCKK